MYKLKLNTGQDITYTKDTTFWSHFKDFDGFSVINTTKNEYNKLLSNKILAFYFRTKWYKRQGVLNDNMAMVLPLPF